MVTPRGDSGAVTPDPEPRQIAVYRIYLQLQSIAKQRYSGALAGHLLLCLGYGQRGSELALATTIAGGVFLGIEPDPQRLKAAVRSGACDFMVNTLDEALRVIKNELRKRTPLSAGLLGNAAEMLAAMVERGVQPDLIAVMSELELAAVPASRQALDQIIERGTEFLHEGGMLADSAVEEVVWTASNQQDLRRMDRIALELLPPDDQIRRRWLEQGPAYFYRQQPLERVLELNPAELARLLERFKSATSSAEFDAPVEIR